MKPCVSLLVILSVLSFVTGGCGNKPGGGDGDWQKSFVQADSPVKSEAQAASLALEAKNYPEAVTIFSRMVQQQQLSNAEKQAIKNAFGEITRAVAADPKLDTAEFYRARSELMEKLYGKL